MRVKFIFILLSLLAITFSIQAQQWNYEKSISLNTKITAQSIDPEGNIYIGTANGNIHRLDSNGDQKELFSAINNFPISLINAWNKFKIFAYIESEQQFHFLDRFNTSPQLYQITDYTEGLVSIATPGLDNSIWILTTGFNELKKYNIQNRRLIISNPLNLKINRPVSMRAFQEFLIIADAEYGIFFFDRFGNFFRQIEEKGINHFQVENDQLIYLKGNELNIRPLRNLELVEKIKIPPRDFYKVLRYQNRFYFIDEKNLMIYSLDS